MAISKTEQLPFCAIRNAEHFVVRWEPNPRKSKHPLCGRILKDQPCSPNPVPPNENNTIPYDRPKPSISYGKHEARNPPPKVEFAPAAAHIQSYAMESSEKSSAGPPSTGPREKPSRLSRLSF